MGKGTLIIPRLSYQAISYVGHVDLTLAPIHGFIVVRCHRHGEHGSIIVVVDNIPSTVKDGDRVEFNYLSTFRGEIVGPDGGGGCHKELIELKSLGENPFFKKPGIRKPAKKKPIRKVAKKPSKKAAPKKGRKGK